VLAIFCDRGCSFIMCGVAAGLCSFGWRDMSGVTEYAVEGFC
jgi:hypothetical protein